MGIENGFIVFTGNANPLLANKICEKLGVSKGEAMVKTFSDGEIQIEIEENVRLKDVFVIQPTCPPAVNDNLMELLLLIDAFKRSSARRITAVIPYFGYARQDKKVAPRVPISAKLVADLLTAAGANRIITMDLHAGQIQGFFNIPVDNLFAMPNLLNLLLKKFKEKTESGKVVIVSPDAGGVERARAFAKRLNCSLAIIDKRRDGPNKAQAMNIIGEVAGMTAIILDDMADTFGTLREASQSIIEDGATEVYAACTHPVLSGRAIENLIKSPIKTMFVSDTITLSNVAQSTGKIEVYTIADLFAEAIIRSHTGESVNSLFV
jgi:ribose-phosphate pyrophosphokinase